MIKIKDIFTHLIRKTNFKMNKFFRTITKHKKHTLKTINVKGRNFKSKIFMKE